MNNSETGDVKSSQEISNIYIELGFMNETLNTLMDMTKDQAEAITAILTHLNKKQDK